MKFLSVVIIVLVSAISLGASPQDAGKDLSWAFPVPDKNFPAEDGDAPRHVPGSSKTYTVKEIADLMNPPDWFPEEHPPAPRVVTHGGGPGVLACGSCHLMSGSGHPESADLTALSAEYIERQLADFKSGARIDQGRMVGIAKSISDEDVKAASEYFSSLKPKQWVTVIEADTVPQTVVDTGRMRLPAPGGATEPLGNRIIELPLEPDRVLSRDPHSGFDAFVPKGSVEKGKELATTGGNGKTIQCAFCHGENLMGTGEVPRIAGDHPIYIVRQIYNFQKGRRSGDSAALMKNVVAKLTDEDILNLAAYVASKQP